MWCAGLHVFIAYNWQKCLELSLLVIKKSSVENGCLAENENSVIIAIEENVKGDLSSGRDSCLASKNDYI